MVSLHKDDPKLERLRAITFFEKADKKALEHLAQAADEVDVPVGGELIREGSRHHEGYVILEGTVKVMVGGAKVAEIGKNEMVGELALLGQHGVASATVVAETPVQALVIPYNRFDQILDENPSLTKGIAEQLAARLQAMDRLYEDEV